MTGDKGARMANVMAVVAGRGSRPCDVCARKRSRWYCAADEAYLCEGCDSSVHAANALAFRHERVRLTSSGAPMKLERRVVNHGDHPSAPNTKKKLKNLRPAPSPCGPTSGSPAFQSPKQQLHNSGLREVKLELQPPNYTISDAEHDGSDDHFTAEELTGNANLLDETVPPSMCQASYDDSNNPDYSSHELTQGAEPDFSHDYLVSDPNDPNSTYATGIQGSEKTDATTPSATSGGVEGVGEDLDEDEEEDVGNEWMDLDLANRDLSDDDQYCIDPSALRESVSAGAPDQSAALYSHDEKPVMSSSSQMGKAFKNMAGQQEWVKVEDGYPNYGVAPQHALANSSCKIEGLPMSEGDLRQVPSLRLNYEDVLSSWSDRSFRCTDDGSGSQLVPGDDTNSDLGSVYDLGLVPDLSNGGIDGGQFPHIYGGCGPCGGAVGGGDDGGANAGNAREFKVNRYREKRRTRKFSKKIRYEVRKVNAERRPRMKGRFVKRSPSRET